MSREELRSTSGGLQRAWDSLPTKVKRDSKRRPPVFEEFSATLDAAQRSGVLDACDVDKRNTYWKTVVSETEARLCRQWQRENDERRAEKLRSIAQKKKFALFLFLLFTFLAIVGGIWAYTSGNDRLKLATAFLTANAVLTGFMSLMYAVA